MGADLAARVAFDAVDTVDAVVALLAQPRGARGLCQSEPGNIRFFHLQRIHRRTVQTDG